MTKKTELTLIILTHNSQFWLKKCLESIKEHYLSKTKLNIEVVVVDNASSDDTPQMMSQSFAFAKYLYLPENVGFAKGNNMALKTVTSPYVMLINSDVEFTKESNLDELVKYLEKNQKTGVVSPKLILASGHIDPASHRGEPTPLASFFYFLRLEKLFPSSRLFSQYHQYYKNLNEVHEVDAVSAAGMMIRKSAMDKVGFLDEAFFMYGEDLDWCRRFRDHNFKIIYYPDVILIHHKNKSGLAQADRKIVQKTKGYFYDTMLQYYDKHYQNKYPKFLRSVIKLGINIIKGVS